MYKIYKYEISNSADWDDLGDYVTYNVFSYTKFSEEEFLEIIEQTCEIVKEKCDKDDYLDMVTYVYAYLVSMDSVFFDIPDVHSVEINTNCCKHDYKVKMCHCGCQGD